MEIRKFPIYHKKVFTLALGGFSGNSKGIFRKTAMETFFFFFAFTDHMAYVKSNSSIYYNLQETLHMWPLSSISFSLPLMLRQFTLHTSAVQCGSDTATEADCGHSSQCLYLFQPCHARFWSGSPCCFCKDKRIHLLWINYSQNPIKIHCHDLSREAKG